jgi:hypothetical protein
MTNVLTLTERHVPGTIWIKGGPFRRGRTEETVEVHLDFMIDGKNLRNWIQEWEEVDTAPEEVSLLIPAQPKLAAEQIDRLVGRRAHQYWDRGWLLFCPCWDEGCGGVTANIRRADGKVYWSRLGWNNSYEPGTDYIKNAPDFVFDELEYEQVLLETRARLVGEQAN